ncbi:MAG TPA: NADH-quinone oxidoreductase subunit M [Ktedonobacterales bacterium]|nr:NADH-quinone oxidoreductase subunit M [Ktedonobacterales bacterium]
MSSFPILSVILFLPLAGAIGALLLPRMAGWWWALLVALADLALCLWLITQFTMNGAGMQFAELRDWLPGLGVSYALGVDGVSLFLPALNALLTAVAVGASWPVARRGDRSREYFTLLLLLSFGMMGVFLATNLLLFYVFWEVMLIPAYLLVGMFGGPRRSYAAIKFVLYTAAGSLLMLVGIIATGALVSSASGAPFTLDLAALLREGVTALPRTTQIWLFLAFAAAFAVKVGLFPLHSWVPDAYGEAPTAVVVLIAGVMAKTGAYGFVRFNLALFPEASRALTPLMSALAVAGILYFALQALVAADFKRLLAYVSISHMSVIVLGTFALNTQGVEGGILQMVNHGILIAALFLIAAFIERRTGSRRLADFGGLATRTPWLATVFLLTALATLGLPGLNSFAGEFLAFLGAFQASAVYGTLGTLVVIPAAWYMLRFFQGVTEGPPSEVVESAAAASGGGASLSGSQAPGDRPSRLPDLRAGELTVLAPLLVLMIVLGILPGLLTARMEPTINQLLAPTTHTTTTHPISGPPQAATR